MTTQGAISVGVLGSLVMLLAHTGKQSLGHAGDEIKPITTITKDVIGTTALAFSPDSKILAAYDRDNDIIRFWEAGTGKAAGVLAMDDTYGNGRIAFSPDGKLLASVHYGRANRMILWDWQKKREVARIDRMRLPRSMAFSPDGKLLAILDDDHLHLFDMGKRELLHRIPHSEGFLAHVAFCPDSKKVAVPSRTYRQLYVFDCEKGRREKVLETERNSKFGCFWWVAWIDDGKSIIALGPQQGISLWDANSGRKVRQLSESIQGINYRVAISPDGKFLTGETARHELILWDLGSLKHAKYLDSGLPTFSPDGKLFAVISPAGIRIWDFSIFKTTIGK